MVKKWVITFKGEKPGSADDFELTFIDIREVLDEFVQFNPSFIEELRDLIQSMGHYNSIKNIKDVRPPEAIDVDIRRYLVILATDKKGRKIGLLLIGIGDDKLVLSALWPAPFAQAISRDRELLDVYVYALVKRPDLWRDVWAVTATA